MARAKHGCDLRQHSGCRPFWLASISFCMIFALLPISADAQTEESGDLTGARKNQASTCDRPYPPSPEFYASKEEFILAREVYYAQASTFVSVCIDMWITEVRNRYQEMFQMEAQSYREERNAVMKEMQDAANLQYP
ncbi:hypothetical protein D2T29_12230 [Sinirhodobacter populi]|uniref:Uncharacterized protein n=1 Tax=Paenirhodobacter populi TaxID=2306993 RepID=A0A443KCU4_9RHOB|nr:hypothetical protein [Sinirhodobacter populi]RWR30433.1 hypothetical protein D2T29_12230 [Sinirhodobacter populi]